MSDRGRPSSADADDRAFFGHPRALGYLVGVEGFWMFSYAGMQFLLTLYMSQQLLLPGHAEHVLGLPFYRSLLEHGGRTLSPLELASRTYGLATGLIFVLPVLGGLIADHWLGRRLTLTIGLVVTLASFTLLSTESGFLIALLLLIAGVGLVKLNLVSQIGGLYAPGDSRRTQAFAYYLIAANVGSMVTPLVSGTLAERVGYRYGLQSLAVGMVICLAVYVAGRARLPADPPLKKAAVDAAATAERLDPRVIVALLVLMLAELLMYATYNQAFNIFPVWAKAHVDLNVFGFQMPVTWFSTLDGILTIVGAMLTVRFWAWQRSRGREMGDASRLVVGCALTAGAFLSLALGAVAAGAGRTSMAPAVGFFMLADPAITWIDTVVLAAVSRAAPRSISSLMLGAYYLSVAIGSMADGWLGGLYESMTPVAFWLIHAGLAGAGAVVFLVLAPWLSRILAPKPEVPSGVAEPAIA
jgi:POT family proton-dependent oligopeptide transporter